MNCNFRSCLFYLFLSVLAAFGFFLLLYIILYIYIAYITTRYNSDDLVRWREDQLEKIEQEYAKMAT